MLPTADGGLYVDVTQRLVAELDCEAVIQAAKSDRRVEIERDGSANPVAFVLEKIRETTAPSQQGTNGESLTRPSMRSMLLGRATRRLEGNLCSLMCCCG
ncbi:hypothetical protein F0562_017648 [Nyssa sinensis]|uniref:Uncharacterized protein n=1 Tax=Nyssa sinensis TaxID=561372 RepID=A0A5J4ZI66_9ASTE|nr:hypothetical protein F0562_017648 [Nyssa sinensis]